MSELRRKDGLGGLTMCEVKVCEGINELRKFIEEVNRKSYEIIAMTEMMHTYTSCYTILYRT